ncbi:MAG: Fe-S protein assembly co-chaperone HscB [Janthinobacterium lividum]
MENYFKLLEIEENYNIDTQVLNEQYLAQQTKYHPDKIINKQEKIHYQKTSMMLNKAYAVLKDDFERAKYLLNLNGTIIDEGKLKNSLPLDKLENIWSQLEEISTIDNLQTLKNLHNQKTSDQQILKLRLSEAFTKRKFQDALDIMIEFKYLIGIIDNIKSKIRNAAI